MRNEKEFKKAYDTHADGIFRFLYFRTGDREMAKELVQEAFLKTWSALAKGTEIDSLKSYLYRVAHNLLVNELRRKREISSLDDEDAVEPIDEQGPAASALSEQELLMRNIGRLSDSYREVLRLKLSDDLSTKEIAAILGKTEGNTSVLIHRATERLKSLYYNEQN